jgi:acyl-coenzyme A thioesterase PaaI-like protein
MAMPKIDLVSWFQRASLVPMGTRAMDRLLWRVVPFNRGIKPRVTMVSTDEVRAEVQLRKDTMNHLGSMHAGVLFTLGEYVQGLVIVANAGGLGAELILKEVSIDYKAKAKGAVAASARMADDVRAEIRAGLERGDNTAVTLVSNLVDSKTGDPLATLKGQWLARRPKR